MTSAQRPRFTFVHAAIMRSSIKQFRAGGLASWRNLRKQAMESMALWLGGPVKMTKFSIRKDDEGTPPGTVYVVYIRAEEITE